MQKNRFMKKQIFINAYMAFSTIAIVMLLFSFKSLKENFEEINVKRINVVEDDGTIRMVISNKSKQHPGRMDGKDLPPRERWAGITFFNDEGDECGGLGFGVQEQNGVVSNGMIFTMDRYKHDQVIQIVNSEFIQDGKFIAQRGLGINDVDDDATLSELMLKMEELESITDENQRMEKMKELQKLAPRNRLFLGKTREDTHGLFIMNDEGRPLLMLYVDTEGNPKFQSMDENGKVIDLMPVK